MSPPSAAVSLRRLAYWGLPPLLLALVFRRVDIARLQTLLQQIDGALFSAGLLASPVVVVLGALRWQMLVRCHPGYRPPLRTTLGDYWRSLAIGVLAPGSIGMDAYRVVLLGRRTGRLLAAAVLVVLEKLAALLACVLLLAVLLPSQAPDRAAGWVRHGGTVAAAALLIALTGAAILVGPGRRPGLRRLARGLRLRVRRTGRRLARKALASGARAEARSAANTVIGAPHYSFAAGAAVLALSVAVFGVSAAQAQLFFAALGQSVDWHVNLLVAPLLFVAFALPITFGTLGVREVAYVLFYGVFGVAAEPALLVSFCALIGLLGNYTIGSVLHLGTGRLPATGIRPAGG